MPDEPARRLAKSAQDILGRAGEGGTEPMHVQAERLQKRSEQPPPRLEGLTPQEEEVEVEPIKIVVEVVVTIGTLAVAWVVLGWVWKVMTRGGRGRYR